VWLVFREDGEDALGAARTTDREGRILVEHAPPGAARAMLQESNFETYSVSFEIELGETTHAKLVRTKADGK